MKVPFDIKYKPLIESGEAKVVTRNDRPVRIICWDGPSDEFPIVGFIEGEVGPDTFTRNGYYMHNGEDFENENLFVILSLPDNIFKQAVDTFGVDHQIGMLHEEMGELQTAINQYARGRVGKDAVVTEIADVMIMCEQMAEIFGREEMETEKRKKIDRLAGEIEKSLSLHSCSI